MVRALLNGRFANTAFCVFDPQGKKRLSRSGRGPSNLGTPGRGGQPSDDSVIREMKRISSRYKNRGDSGDIVLQDFNTFRQALNVASADQRLLVFAKVDKDKRGDVENTLQQVFADEDVVGKFHLNFFDDEQDKDWYKKIKGANSRQTGILIIRSGQFGLDGELLKRLPDSASTAEITKALSESNSKFAKIEKRKTYADHVRAGRRKGIYFENEIPYGEDRDGDGKIDHGGVRRRKK